MRAPVIAGVPSQADGQPGRQPGRGEDPVNGVGDVLGVVGAQPRLAELVGQQAHMGGEVPAGVDQRDHRVGAFG
ncbi:hypothetical protein ACFOY2_43610 [Nonomuraea purpurea]|uniref:Uncharacterized protein n=1 Tax=Nonomuraea purpurea TaxID=1849276 RepID=A0ABV8GJP5_9ACTN